MLRLRWILAICALSAFAHGARAADEYPFDDPYPFETRDFDAQKLRETEHMKLGENAAPWLPPIIAAMRANRPPMHELRQVALFPAERDGGYLVTTWLGGYMREMYVQFHRIEIAPDGRRVARFVREIIDHFTFVDAPTGFRLKPDGAPVVVVGWGSGGMMSAEHGMQFIMLARNTIDITPQWAGRLSGFADVDKDGVEELISYDDRWNYQFHGRSVAGPHLPLVIAIKNGRFVKACAAKASIYRRLAAQYEAHATNDEMPAVLRSEAYGAQVLALAQIGDIAAARAALARFDDFYRAKGAAIVDTETPDEVQADYKKAIDEAEAADGTACAVSVDIRRPPTASEEFDSFSKNGG